MLKFTKLFSTQAVGAGVVSLRWLWLKKGVERLNGLRIRKTAKYNGDFSVFKK